ncbi:MAG: M3 family metallopeptidase [Proteobacteria bacterium]|nr:M3 family metallopeptidase [Pseudomonadota bacterium]
MKRHLLLTLSLVISLAGCAGSVKEPAEPVAPVSQETQAAFTFTHKTMLDQDNPFAQQSGLPYGLVDFTKIRPEHYMPAFEAGMAQQLEEVAQIVDQEAEPTFENTLIPLELSGALLDKTAMYFSNDAGSNTNDAIKAVQKELAPKLAAHNDAIFLNDKLFRRVETLYEKRNELGLDAESLRLLEEYYKDFVRAGAKLSVEEKAQIMQINAELATLTTAFGQNILSETNDSAVIFDDAAALDGLSEAELKNAAEAARDRGLDGKYLIALKNTTIQPVLKSLNNRETRKKIHEASISRGLRGNEADNSKNAFRIAELRTQRANMLGYPTYADYSLDVTVAKNKDAVNEMQRSFVEPAKQSLAREKAELQALIDAENGGFELAAYDWFYYSEKLRKQKYDLDDNALKPYFELGNVVQNGVFYAANQLYGVTFKERKDIPVNDPDVKVFEVFDADGQPLALFIADYYARPSKRGGAWKANLDSQSKLKGGKPIVLNQINIAKPAAGEPTLLTYDEVTTVFHEFGHALHEMFSNVTYPRFAGTRVPRDFVEFPSQFNEIWALWPGILDHYAVHYQTGEKLPQALVDKIIDSSKFNQGYMTTEHLAAAMLDQKWHQMTLEQLQALPHDDLAGVEKKLLGEAGLDIPTTPPRYRTAYYNHVFAGGYAAGYYAYMWSEVIDADAEDWFKTHGLSRENGDHLRKTILSKGYTEDCMKLYHDFAGRAPSVEPLLIRRGLK